MIPETALEVEGVTVAHAVRRRSRHARRAGLYVGIALLTVIVLAAIFAPLLSQWGPNQQDLIHVLSPPSGKHLLGTDQLGRDVWSRLLYGARIDLLVGFGAMIVPFSLGSALGVLAGVYGGFLDLVVGTIADAVMAFPYYVLLSVLVFFLGAGLFSIFVAVAIVAWVSYARIMRAEMRSAMKQEYVVAALGAGLPLRRVVVRHVVPNIVDQAVVYLSSDIVLVIVGTATLSYFGLGVSPPTAEWGSMVNAAQPFISTHPLLAIAPGIAIVLVGVALGLIGQGLTDWLRSE